MKRLKGMRSHYERVPANRLPPDLEALRRVDDDTVRRDREAWRAVLTRILALANEVHPGLGMPLSTETKRLWRSLKLGPLPVIPKGEWAIMREFIARAQRQKAQGKPVDGSTSAEVNLMACLLSGRTIRRRTRTAR
jgi:hypothetical protein